MKVSNINFTSYNPIKAQGDLKELKIAAKKAVNCFHSDVNPDEARKVFDEKMLDLAAKAKEIKKEASNNISSEKSSKVMDFVTSTMNSIANSKLFKKIADSDSKNVLAYVLVVGNACKEAMGTAIYTLQALTNEDLPPDKRKFVGMYDLAVGLVSTSLSLVAGLAMVKGQDALVKKLIGGAKAEKMPGFVRATAGMAFLLPVVLQTILIKRIVAPAVATPVAGHLKKALEEREAAKKGLKPPAETPVLIPSEALILAKNTAPSSTNFLQSSVSQFKQKLNA